MESTGDLSNGAEMNNAHGIRPSISLKKGTKLKAGGDGTASNPYEVE